MAHLFYIIHLFLKIHPIGKGRSLRSNYWNLSNRLWLLVKFSVKLFMKNIIFSFIFIVFAGCAPKDALKPDVTSIPAKIAPPTPSVPAITNAVPEKATDTAAPATEVVSVPSKKIDYDAINKSILKDVSKKIVDKASKKD